MRSADPQGLGRGPLTRWLPVHGQASADPPEVGSFEAKAEDTPGRFLMKVLFSLPRATIPAMLLAMVWQVGESAVPVVMGLAIDRALATGDTGQLVLWIGVLVALYIALTSAARLSLRLTISAQQLMQHRLRATLSARVLHPAGSTARAPDGGVVSVMTNDVARLAAAGLVVHPIAEIAAIGFIAVSLLVTHWPLGVVVLLGAPLVLWLMGVLSKRLSHDTREYQTLLAATVGRATDLVAGYRVIKGLRAESEATVRYRQVSQETLVGARRNAGLLGRFLVGSGVVTGVFVTVVTALAGWFAVNGQLSIGALITTVGLTQALLPQMQMLARNAVPALAAARASSAHVLDRLREDHAAAPETEEATRANIAPLPAVQVYVPGAPIQVDPGEMVGVRADDRTSARIADALLNPQIPGERDNGIEVRLGGRTARELAPAEYRSRITVAPHRVTLFTGTILDNLTTSTTVPELLEAALRAAACKDFVDDLDSPVGENGNRLSGGQRQRVALARALATDAPILVLHDPTTAVDSVTEHAIAGRLRDIRADRSTLLIASSPALLGACDRVVDLLANEPGVDRSVAP